jgi:hypothetical protein
MIDQHDSVSDILHTLVRTFTPQIEALKRYRSTAAEDGRVTHQHVSVTANQAVIRGNQAEGVRMRTRAKLVTLVELRNEAPRCPKRSNRAGCQSRAPAGRKRHLCRYHGAASGRTQGGLEAWPGGT